MYACLGAWPLGNRLSHALGFLPSNTLKYLVLADRGQALRVRSLAWDFVGKPLHMFSGNVLVKILQHIQLIQR